MIAHLLLAVTVTVPPPGGVGELVLTTPVAVAAAPAVRTGNTVQETPTLPPPPTTTGPPAFSSDAYNGRCVGAEPLLAYYSPGWDVARMSRIMHRESRCLPWADNPFSTASGLLQILASHCGKWLGARMGEECTMVRLKTADFNIRAARVLWQEDGYRPWALTD